MSCAVTLQSLATRRVWVAWQVEQPEGRKQTKVPYSPAGGLARANDPQTWGTRAEAEARASSLPKPLGAGGIGIEFAACGNGLRYGGIDLDTCRDPATGAIEPWATKVVQRFNTYTETSPSGTGLKAFFVYSAADLPEIQTVMGHAKYGKEFKRGSGNHPRAIELHVGNRYFTVTEQHFKDTPIEFRHVPATDILWLLAEYGPAFVGAENGKKSGNDKSRSAAAFRKGATLRREGKSFEEMAEVLRADPEIAEWMREKGEANGGREMRRIWERTGDAAILAAANLTEDGIALAFSKRYRDRLRYCHDTGAWFEWDGNLWRREETMLAFDWCRRVCRDAASMTKDRRARIVLGRASTASAIERFSRADRAFAVTAAAWDNDPFLLGTPAGTVDLRTGRLRPAMQTDCITKSTAVVPSETADCPQWLRFLDDATRDDAGMIYFLKQWCGYCVTGDIREHALLFIFGPGGNGKSVLLNTISRILGDYATVAAMDTFTASHGDRHPTDLAMLRGARLVCVSETEEGRAWAENRIKALTGGDPITARFMRCDFFTFTPTFKITVIGNHKPVLRNVDDAARRRFNLAPFVNKPTVPDKLLGEKLRAEWPGILRWMIDGCLDWQRHDHGLVRPTIVTSATAEYFADQDTVRQWVEDCCETTIKPPHLADTWASLFASWRSYAFSRGEEPGGSKGFSARLQNLGLQPIKDSDGIRGRGFKGLKVRIHHEGSYAAD